MIMIATAGTVRVYDDMYKYAVGVADGTIKAIIFYLSMYELDSKRMGRPYGMEKGKPRA